ncbi:unnamed protein product [Sphagnum jensenii]|uniref:Alpha/beta hydrolase fold-5 domain-containing protein n=1 Tax=Sphagnum jensenii TaxID=128206 RepID=A0ABP0WAE4_9BRYO
MVSVVHCLALMSMLLLASSYYTVECVAKEAAVIALELAQVASAAALCVADDEALAALREDEADNITVSYTPEIGYGFVDVTANVTRGLVFLPEVGVAPEAYAVYARKMARHGFYAAIVEKGTIAHVVRAMMQRPYLQYWSLLGHGKGGGAVAARMAFVLHPKIKALILLAAALPEDVDLRSLNLLLTVIYGGKDTVVTPQAISKSFSQMAGDTRTVLFPNLGHFDFVHSDCKGNELHPSQDCQGVLTSDDVDSIANELNYVVTFSRWSVASARALSYGDNEKLTPGHNDSKPYPGDIRVNFTELPIPGTSPQRLWWIFTPSQITGGIIYYPGAAVDGRAYFPLAFEIAARGHLVVVVQQPLRNAVFTFQDANVVLNSNLSVFSGVPKDRWAIAGHSLGGAGATLYAGAYGRRVYAAVLHAGVWCTNLTLSELPVVQIYGTLDCISPGGYQRYRDLNVDPPPKGFGPLVNLNTTQFIPIDSANHYQVGDYGYQDHDQIATISLEQQQIFFAEETVKFLNNIPLKGNGILSCS